MKRHYSIDMTTGSITKKLVQFVLPLMASLLLQQLYNAADKAVVGRFAEDGAIALAAVGATGSPSSLIINLVIGLSAGAGIISANLLGGKRMEELRRNMHTSVMMGLVCGVLLAVLGVCVARPFLILMSCPDNVLDLAVLYMRIFFLGMPASMVYNFASGILRTFGDSRRPMVILGVSGLMNVLLNLVFVIWLKMSVAGVALATILAQIGAAVWVLWILFNPRDDYKMSFRELNLYGKEVTAILRVGIPCSLNSIMFSISNVILQATINGYGDAMIAGSAASDSLTNIYYQILSAFYTATMTFAGQCYGAGKIRRVRQLLLRSTGISMGILTGVAIVSTVMTKTLVGFFNTDPEVLQAGAEKLIIVAWGYVLYGMLETTMGCLRGMRKNVVPTVISICCVCLLRVVWVVFIYPLNPSVWFLYFCYPATYVVSLCFMMPYYFSTIRRMEKDHAASIPQV